MKNLNIFIIIGIIVIIVIAGFFIFFQSFKSSSGLVVTSSGGETQKIVLGIKDFNYYPNTITVKAGQPVSISLDSSVTGCLRTFTIPSFGISKTLKSPSDTIDFTPTEKGTYKFACSMGMGYGTIIVE